MPTPLWHQRRAVIRSFAFPGSIAGFPVPVPGASAQWSRLAQHQMFGISDTNKKTRVLGDSTDLAIWSGDVDRGAKLFQSSFPIYQAWAIAPVAVDLGGFYYGTQIQMRAVTGGPPRQAPAFSINVHSEYLGLGYNRAAVLELAGTSASGIYGAVVKWGGATPTRSYIQAGVISINDAFGADYFPNSVSHDGTYLYVSEAYGALKRTFYIQGVARQSLSTTSAFVWAPYSPVFGAVYYDPETGAIGNGLSPLYTIVTGAQRVLIDGTQNPYKIIAIKASGGQITFSFYEGSTLVNSFTVPSAVTLFCLDTTSMVNTFDSSEWRYPLYVSYDDGGGGWIEIHGYRTDIS